MLPWSQWKHTTCCVKLENLTGNTSHVPRAKLEKKGALPSSWLCRGQSGVSMAAVLSATTGFDCNVVGLASGAPVAF